MFGDSKGEKVTRQDSNTVLFLWTMKCFSKRRILLFLQHPYHTPPSFLHNVSFDSRNPNEIIPAFKEMMRRGLKPNGITFSIVTKAFSNIKDLTSLMGIHALLMRLGFRSDIFALNILCKAYVACGSINIAKKLFDEIPKRDLVGFTMLMNGYVRKGKASEAINLFLVMREEGIRADGMAIVSVYNACAQIGDLSLAKRLARIAVEDGVFYDKQVMNSLIDMYAKCQSIENAREIFDSMVDKDIVTWNSMVSGYSRSGMMLAAREIFEQIPYKNEVSWSALIDGYVKNGDFMEALSIFRAMQKIKEIVPNNAAFTSAFTACAHLGALDFGREIHFSLDVDKVIDDVVLNTALVDMYAKCGCLEMSQALFDRIEKKTLVSWNVMITATAMHGNALGCFDLLSRLLRVGLRPSSETFLGILSGCAHAGLLNEGNNWFIRMKFVYGITPRIEHYSCMAHLLGHMGLLNEAYELIISMPSYVRPDATLWGALLTACNLHDNIKLGEFVATRILELEPLHGGAYVQLSSMYAKAGMWKEVLDIRLKMTQRGIQKRPGWSLLEINGVVHEFRVGDESNPMIKEILSLLNGIDTLVSSMPLVNFTSGSYS